MIKNRCHLQWENIEISYHIWVRPCFLSWRASACAIQSVSSIEHSSLPWSLPANRFRLHCPVSSWLCVGSRPFWTHQCGPLQCRSKKNKSIHSAVTDSKMIGHSFFLIAFSYTIVSPTFLLENVYAVRLKQFMKKKFSKAKIPWRGRQWALRWCCVCGRRRAAPLHRGRQLRLDRSRGPRSNPRWTCSAGRMSPPTQRRNEPRWVWKIENMSLYLLEKF